MSQVEPTEVKCRDGYSVEIEPEATHTGEPGKGVNFSKPPYEIWLSLLDEGKQVSSTSVPVPDLNPATIRAAAYGYAEGWDQH